MSKESLENAISSLEVWLIVFACLVAIGVGGEFIVGWVSWNRHRALKTLQNHEEQQLNITIEELRKTNADLFIETSILKRPRWQSFDGNRFFDAVKGGPKANIVILFWPNDQGSAEMAGNLLVGFARADWPVIEQRVFNTNEIRTGGNLNILQGETAFALGVTEVKVLFNDSFFPKGMQDTGTSVGTIFHALSEAQIVAGKPRRLFVSGWLPLASVPTNTIKLLVGQGF